MPDPALWPNDVSLGAVRTHIEETKAAGGHGHCPACRRYFQVYKRNINWTMTRALIWLVRNAGLDLIDPQWVNIQQGPEWLLRSKQLSTLKYWNLIEPMPNDDPTKKKSGVWRPTQLGVAFVTNELHVPKYVLTYDDVVEGVSPETVSVLDCLDKHFDYGKLLRGEME